MTVYRAPVDEIGFVLDRLVGLYRLPAAAALTPETTAAILTEAARFAETALAPLNATGDRAGAFLDGECVRTAPGFKDAYARFAAGGWMGMVFPERYGGQALPWALNSAVGELWSAANLAFQLCPLLTQGAVEALLQHADEGQRAAWLPALVQGRWTAGMCLTEPQAGSDVGAIRTTAEPAHDPLLGAHHRLRGQKIYVTWGDHDLTANLLHLVLARLPDAPPGTRGLTLFVVPKLLPDGTRNDWRVLKLEAKLGIHASPTCVIAYGDGAGAVGHQVGAPQAGMRAMFTMMNNARLAVGVQGLGLAERSFQAAVTHARGRVQGQRQGRSVAIVEHLDIRRLLIGMRAQIAAMRALCLTASAAVDRALQHPDADERRCANGRVALLTPVVKAWCTDRAVGIAGDAIQVLGGMGFIEEAGVAQHYRDARILPIYEGTNGIQALDLAGRKLMVEDGQLPWRLFAELEAEPIDAALRPTLDAALAGLKRATRHLQAGDALTREAVAVPYLELFGWVVGGFLLARGAAAAADDPRGRAWPGLARFYVDRLLPPALGLATVVETAGSALDAALLDS